MEGVGGWACHDLYFSFTLTGAYEAIFQRLSIPSVSEYIDHEKLDLGIALYSDL